jgi:hypothetical protein
VVYEQRFNSKVEEKGSIFLDLLNEGGGMNDHNTTTEVRRNTIDSLEAG